MISTFNKFKEKILQQLSKEQHYYPTVELAVDKIMSGLSDIEKRKIVNTDEKKLSEFHLGYGIFLKNEFSLWTNESLKKSCCELSGLASVNPDQASHIIFRELKKKIIETGTTKVEK